MGTIDRAKAKEDSRRPGHEGPAEDYIRGLERQEDKMSRNADQTIVI